MIDFMGIEYARGATANIRNDGPAMAPAAVKQMFPDADWTTVVADNISPDVAARDRFGDAFSVHKKVYNATPQTRHIMIGGDHSVNFGHFATLADRTDDDLCLVYIDAHLDIHTPETSRIQASGAPHGTNVRALLGDGDERWLGLPRRKPALKPQNLFYIGTRAFEPAEIEYARANNIYIRTASELKNESDWSRTYNEIMKQIGRKPFVVSFDFDAIDPTIFPDVWVPEPGGISLAAAKYFVTKFRDADSFEFVEYVPSGDEKSAKIVHDLISIVVNG